MELLKEGAKWAADADLKKNEKVVELLLQIHMML